ncbi:MULTISPECIES: TetR/AcrR family transcriptional regulator [unclassified Mycobacterium]|uniref:TetR/AcrR family transcriptional regulator n=1 Tax=unclassified Mycobacterium TaxID=2642494 RepID=UPI0029C836BD|nr:MULTISPECIES: TetR/AcrR family transcriptional regulator [unclassified Mycobacterium]
MTQPSGQATSLRAAKLARTRLALIDAAVDLCLRRGYEHTTVEQIAAAADVSPRTFSRYFPSKDAVFVAVLDDVADAVATELDTLPTSLGPFEAMRVALGAVVARARDTPFGAFSPDRFTRIVQVVTSSDSLRRAAIEYRGPQVVEALAHRMDVDVDDPRLALVMAVVSVTVVHAWSVLSSSDIPLDTGKIHDQIDDAFFDLARYAADLRTDGR